MSVPTGTRLGPYEVLGLIGAGGMGEVYRARDTRLGRDVALKILPPEVANDLSRRQRFELEARAVAALSHPNIVAVYDVGNENGVFYIVSELVDGEPLRGAKFGLRKTIEIAVQITNGLAAAHDAGIVHRDLKPENVLLTRDGRAKILDFGLAKMQTIAVGDATQTLQTQPGMVMGTVGYMSPEQVRGIEADHRSDIFSFGVILYELLAAKRAFQGETSVDTMQAILRQDPPDLPETVPPGVRQIVQHCLERDPARRFQSARDLGFALSQTTTPSGPAPAVARLRNWRWPAVALVAAALGVAAYAYLWRAPEQAQWSGVLLGGPEMALGPRLSPDGHLLAFEAMVDGQTHVALMKPESGNWSILTHKHDRGTVSKVAWSPDGAVIYYDRMTGVPDGIYSVPVLGGDEHLVLENACCPEVLPDGSILVRRLNSQGQAQLFRFWPETGRIQDLPLLVSIPGIANPNLRITPGGRRAVAVGRPIANRDQLTGLFAIDLASNILTRLTPRSHPDETIRSWMVTNDGTSVLTATSAGRIMRISSIPTSGRFQERTLFTATSEVLSMDGGSDRSVYLNLVDRPADLVRLSPNGETQEKFATFPSVPDIPSMIMMLPDGRTVVTSFASGRCRLVAVERGKDPVSLVNTLEETASHMTLVGARQIAFVIGPAPHQTIAVADIGSGRIAGRIAPGKGTIDSLTSSPDGKTLYFATGGVLWAIPSTGGDATKIGSGDSAVMEANGHSLLVQRKERSRIRLFHVPVNRGPEQELPTDDSIPLYAVALSPGAIDWKGRLLLSLSPRDSWFNPTGILDTATGRVTRVPSANLSDVDSAAWTADGHIMTLQKGLRATIWKFHQEAR